MSSPPSRFLTITKHLDLTKKGLEIGPSINPIVPKREGYDVKTLDHANAAEIREKYRQMGVDVSRVEEIDYIWSGEPIDELVAGERFAYIIASHVIEHVPDLISFLKQLTRILEEDGKISLVVPDKRFTFDFNRQLSTTGQLLEAFLEKRTKPSAGMVFDFTADFTDIEKKERNSIFRKEKKEELSFSLQEAEGHMLNALNSSEYSDIHQWCFTYASFKLIMNDLFTMGYLPFVFDHIHPVSGFEFFVVLKKKNNSPGQTVHRQELLNELAVEQTAWNMANCPQSVIKIWLKNLVHELKSIVPLQKLSALAGLFFNKTLHLYRKTTGKRYF